MLCCLGDLVEDIVVHLSSGIVEASDTDVVISRRRGGSAANVAVAAAAEGAQSRFIGRVGEDTAGRMLISELAQVGVEPCVQQAGRTGSIVVLVDAAGERSMLRDRGAAGELGPLDTTWLDRVSWLHVPAYSLIGGQTAVTTREVISLIHDREVPVSIDASSVAVISEYGVTAFAALVGECAPDVLLCNAEEARILFGDAVPRLEAVGLIVVKDGPNAAKVFAAGGDVASVPAPEIAAAADTTGAGDAFAAGFIVATMGGAAVEEALEAGHLAAGRLLLSQ